jgi:hypothetical protein
MTKNLISKCLACRRPSQAGGPRQICKSLQSIIYVYSIYQLISVASNEFLNILNSLTSNNTLVLVAGHQTGF